MSEKGKLPFGRDLSFQEALQRIVKTNLMEIKEMVAKREKEKPPKSKTLQRLVEKKTSKLKARER